MSAVETGPSHHRRKGPRSRRAGGESRAVGKAGLRSLAHSLHTELAPEGIRVATVTVCGFIRPGGPFDPAKIAAEYLRLHRQSAAAFEAEVVFRGA